ncbi:CpaE-like family protein [Actinoplanes sp. KI2]|uniref:septum site-determining protein Ssd n=1 Tax=Actinoplanes sp. KI2 TaxID=2983315 RepID=UPI0021D570D8|nr:septum site-determining protein Ssd [Actinoplanes sp. KI2]MCU7724146.1 CpaE-like family protein [Actinoplanes sp. KI2]
MSAPRLPLVVTADQDLLDDLLRLAAAGGTEVEVAPDPAAARARLPDAPFLVLGADQVGACLRARLPRHPRTLIVGRHTWPPGVEEVVARLGPVHVCLLPSSEAWLVDRFAERSAEPPPATGRTLAVIGGCGGAGASTLAGGLAVTAVRTGRRTLLVDADPLGGGLDLLLGWEGLDGLRWPALARAGGRVDAPALLRALPRRGDLVLLSFARQDATHVPSEAMAVALDAGRSGRDVIIADLPRHLDDAAVLALQAADRAVLVVPAELRATAGASRMARLVRVHRDDLALVVRGPAPGRLRPAEISRALGLPLAGLLQPDPEMCRQVEYGRPPAATGKGQFAKLCRHLIEELAA